MAKNFVKKFGGKVLVTSNFFLRMGLSNNELKSRFPLNNLEWDPFSKFDMNSLGSNFKLFLECYGTILKFFQKL